MVNSTKHEISLTNQLRQTIEKHYSINELMALLYDLNIPPEDIQGASKSELVRSLVHYLRVHNRLDEFKTLAKEQRPNIDWGTPEPLIDSYTSTTTNNKRFIRYFIFLILGFIPPLLIVVYLVSLAPTIDQPPPTPTQGIITFSNIEELIESHASQWQFETQIVPYLILESEQEFFIEELQTIEAELHNVETTLQTPYPPIQTLASSIQNSIQTREAELQTPIAPEQTHEAELQSRELFTVAEVQTLEALFNGTPESSVAQAPTPGDGILRSAAIFTAIVTPLVALGTFITKAILDFREETRKRKRYDLGVEEERFTLEREKMQIENERERVALAKEQLELAALEEELDVINPDAEAS